ncbi:hypothetical protein WAI453_004686 [Rhynchosporium graminicola]
MGPEVLYYQDCIRQSLRSFLFYSEDGEKEVVLCYAKDAHPRTHMAIHQHKTCVRTPKLEVNMGFNADRKIPIRYWSIESNNKRAAQGVFVRGTAARPLDPNPAKAAQMAQAFHYDKSFGDHEIVISALSELEKNPQRAYAICNSYETARMSLAANEFVLFPFLPLELRRQIWKYASDHTRFIQIVHQSPPDAPVSKILHKFYKVARPSCQPPPMLHASSESRREGLMYYKQFKLEFRFPDDPEKRVYFNPTVDILLFATGTCTGTLIQFCRIAFLRNQKFRRVAITSSRRFADCCDHYFCWRRRSSPGNPGLDFVSEPIDILRGINTSGNAAPPANWGRSMHVPRLRKDPSSMRFFPGISGLEEVIHVMDTYLDKPQQVDNTTTFRIADTSIVTDATEKKFLATTVELMRRYSSGEHAEWETPDTNTWLGSTLPEFSYINLTSIKPFENGNIIKEYELWDCHELERSAILRGDVRRVLESITGCHIFFPTKVIGVDRDNNMERLEYGIGGPTNTAVQAGSIAVDIIADDKASWCPSFRRYLQDGCKDLIPSTINNQTLARLSIAAPRTKVPNRLIRRGRAAYLNKSPLLVALEQIHSLEPLEARSSYDAKLVFPPNTDKTELHKWWLVDRYYRRVYVDWIERKVWDPDRDDSD